MQASRIRNRLLARVFTRFPALAARWSRRLVADRGQVPWSPPRKPLREAVVALVTTGGVHLVDQAPFDMGDPDGDPSFREVPTDAPPVRLTITHDYYDHRDADADLNLVFPAERLREWVDRRCLGGVHGTAYALMGHIDGPHVDTLVRETAPEVARRLRRARVDYALLVPA